MVDVDIVLMVNGLKAIENRVQTDFMLNSMVSICSEAIKKFTFFKSVESIYNFISKTNKTIKRINEVLQFLVEKLNSQGERGAIRLSREHATLHRNLIKKGFH